MHKLVIHSELIFVCYEVRVEIKFFLCIYLSQKNKDGINKTSSSLLQIPSFLFWIAIHHIFVSLFLDSLFYSLTYVSNLAQGLHIWLYFLLNLPSPSVYVCTFQDCLLIYLFYSVPCIFKSCFKKYIEKQRLQSSQWCWKEKSKVSRFQYWGPDFKSRYKHTESWQVQMGERQNKEKVELIFRCAGLSRIWATTKAVGAQAPWKVNPLI